MPARRDGSVDDAGEELDAFARARCKCGAEVYFERREVGKTQTCEKCDRTFTVRITRDNHGREQVIALFGTLVKPAPQAARPPARPPTKTPTRRGKTPSKVKGTIKGVRVNELPPIVMQRPKEEQRDGSFQMEVLRETSSRPAPDPPPACRSPQEAPPRGVGEGGKQPPPARNAGPFEKVAFTLDDPFEKATFGQPPAPGKPKPPPPYAPRKETSPGVIYTTCPCGEPALVRKQDFGQRIQCPACRKRLLVDVTRDPQSRELVIRLRPA